MLAAPLMSSLALLWIAVEVTTIISALLVAIEDTDGAAEAAWKYVLIASAGLSLALLGTVFAYYAGAQVLGEHYDLAIQPLIAAGPHLAATPVRARGRYRPVCAAQGAGAAVGQRAMRQPVRPRRGGTRRGQRAAAAAARADPRRD
jgi:hypothetical protein